MHQACQEKGHNEKYQPFSYVNLLYTNYAGICTYPLPPKKGLLTKKKIINKITVIIINNKAIQKIKLQPLRQHALSPISVARNKLGNMPF